MSGQRARSGVNSMGSSAGSPALTLAVTSPMHSDRPSSTAREEDDVCLKILRCASLSFCSTPSKADAMFNIYFPSN